MVDAAKTEELREINDETTKEGICAHNIITIIIVVIHLFEK